MLNRHSGNERERFDLPSGHGPRQRAGPRGAAPGPDDPRRRRRRLHRLRARSRGCSSAATRSACSTACTSASSRWRTSATGSSSSSPTCATSPTSALDGVDGVINLAGLSQRPDRRVRPRGQLADERGRHRDARPACASSAASSASSSPPPARSTTACRPACTTRPPPIQPRGAYATSKRYGEEALLELADEGLVPGDPAQRHGLRLQPADALRPRGQHVRQGRAAQRQAAAARRRLDVAPARRRARRLRRDDRRLRGARREGPRRDLQRPALELPDPRAGDARRRLGAARDRPRDRARGGPGAEAHARLRVLEREALDDARASSRATRCSRR